SSVAIPIYKADNTVKIYACIAVTTISIKPINNEKATETGATATVSKIKINDINAKMIMCPAVIFANKRIINEIGFTNIPTISIGIKKIFIGTGTPGIQNICFQ